MRPEQRRERLRDDGHGGRTGAESRGAREVGPRLGGLRQGRLRASGAGPRRSRGSRSRRRLQRCCWLGSHLHFGFRSRDGRRFRKERLCVCSGLCFGDSDTPGGLPLERRIEPVRELRGRRKLLGPGFKQLRKAWNRGRGRGLRGRGNRRRRSRSSSLNGNSSSSELRSRRRRGLPLRPNQGPRASRSGQLAVEMTDQLVDLPVARAQAPEELQLLDRLDGIAARKMHVGRLTQGHQILRVELQRSAERVERLVQAPALLEEASESHVPRDCRRVLCEAALEDADRLPRLPLLPVLVRQRQELARSRIPGESLLELLQAGKSAAEESHACEPVYGKGRGGKRSGRPEGRPEPASRRAKPSSRGSG